MLKISGKTINLRQLKKNDASSIAENANDRGISRFTSLPYLNNVDSADLFIKIVN